MTLRLLTILSLACISLSACSSNSMSRTDRAVLGGALGAGAGGVATKSVGGAAVGAVVGAGIGAITY